MKAFANGLKRFMAVIFTVVLIADLVPAEALVMNIYATESGSVAAGDTSGDNVTYPSGGSESDNENNDSNTSDGGSSTESVNNDSNTSGGTSSNNGNDSSTTSGEGNDAEPNDSNVTNGGDNSGSTTGKDESGTNGKTDSGTTGKTESAKPTVTVKPETKLAGDDQKKDDETPPEDSTTSPSVVGVVLDENSPAAKVDNEVILKGSVTFGVDDKGNTLDRFYYFWKEGELTDQERNSSWPESKNGTVTWQYKIETAGEHVIYLYVRNNNDPLTAVDSGTCNIIASDTISVNASTSTDNLMLNSTVDFLAKLSGPVENYNIAWSVDDGADGQGSVLTQDAENPLQATYTINNPKSTGKTHTIKVTASPKNGGDPIDATYDIFVKVVQLEDIKIENDANELFKLNQNAIDSKVDINDTGYEVDFNNNGGSERKYTVTVIRPDLSDEELKQADPSDDTKYVFPADQLGIFTINVSCQTEDENANPKAVSAVIKYTVRKPLTIAWDNKLINKRSDGTTAVKTAKKTFLKHFSVEGFLDNDSDYATLKITEMAKAKYTEMGPGNGIGITFEHSEEDPFFTISWAKGHTDRGNFYYINELPSSVKGNITAAELSAAVINLTKVSDAANWEFSLEDKSKNPIGVTLKIDSEAHMQNCWFNVLSKIIDVETEGAELLVYGDDGKLKEYPGPGAVECSTPEAPNEVGDIYVKKGDIVYGPITVIYNYDNKIPDFGGITITTSQTGILWDKTSETHTATDDVTESGLSFEKDGAIVVTNEKVILSNVLTKDAESGPNEAQYVDGNGVFCSETKITTKEAISSVGFSDSVTLEAAEESKTYYVYVKLVDNAGNISYRGINGEILADKTAPTATITFDQSYAGATANLKVETKDDASGSGIYSITARVYDGLVDSKPNFYYEKALFDSSDADYSGNNSPVTGNLKITAPGSQQWVMIIVKDWAGNVKYYDHNGIASNEEEEWMSKVNLENTFMVYPDDMKVQIQYSSKGSGYAVRKNREDSTINDYIFIDRTKINVTFSNIPVSDLSYKWGDEETSITSEDYDVKKHCYKYTAFNGDTSKDGKYTFILNVPKLNGEKSVKVEGIDEFASATTSDTGLTTYTDEFIIDSTAPIVDFIVNKDIAGSKDNTYYYGLKDKVTCEKDSDCEDITINITVEEENWYEEDIPKLYITYKDKDGNSQTSEAEAKWSSGEDAYTHTLDYTIKSKADHSADGSYTFLLSNNGQDKSYVNYHEFVDKLAATYKNEEGDHTKTCVIDTVRPTLTYMLTSNGYNDEYAEADKVIYFKSEFTETFTVNDVNKAPVKIETYYKAPDADLDPDEQSGIDVSITAKEDGIYWYTVSGADLAGNLLTFVAFADKGGSIKATQMDQDSIASANVDNKGKFTTYRKVLDTTSPKVDYQITELKEQEKHQYAEADYYNYKDGFTVTFKVDELNFDAKKITADGFGWKSSEGKPILERKVDVDGEYIFTISGEDKAGNKIKVAKDKENNKSADPDESGDDGVYTTHKKVLDRIAPEYRVEEMTEPASAENVEGDRVYFNKNISVKFKVTDSYLDDKKIKATIASKKGAGNYEKDEVTWSDLSLNKDDKGSGNATEINRSLSVSATKDHSNDGIYRFEIAGEDKAGNKLVRAKSKCDINNKAYNRTEPHGDGTGEFWTMIKVIDTTAPQGEIAIGKYYIADLKAPKVLEVRSSEPYRKETSASGTVKVTSDNSPVKIAYPLTSQVGGKNQGKLFGDYKYNNSVSFSTQGEQVFFLTVTLTDRAGNTTGPIKTNSIYLDVTPPTEDTLAPSISIVANANSSAHGPAGNPLFSSSVPISVVVSDPNATARSSGLAEISYEILVDGQVKNTGILNQKGTTKWNGKYNDPSLTYKISKSVTADSSLNSNNIVIRVKAADNSGNTSQKEYNFGIDITAPKISVTYDNNDVQNEKYFKADRTATIVVTERNFDPSRINITTNGGSQSDWSFSNNGGNGDNDTWTKRITYGSDGDYTLGVNGSDILGHQASDITYNGAAPREFTVDKTIPVITISFDIGQGYKGSKYFNETRTGTVTIFEHNFRASDARVDSPGFISRGEQPSASQGGWSDSGDNHYMSIVFDQDGDYTITANYTDLAGNVALVATADEFTIDKTKPEIEFDSSTVQANHAYQGVIAPRIIFSDTNYDPEGVTFTLTGIKDSRGKVLKLTEVFSDETGYGGSISYENFANIRANDDIYTATGIIVDRAGNQSEVTITFSVNRFGSTWDYNDDKTTEGLIHRYTNEEKDVFLREINVNEVTEYSIFMTHDSDVVELKEGTDYEVNASEATGWKQYVYKFYKKNFEAEGTYNIVVQTKDAAGNSNTNSSMKNENGSEAVPLQYSIDKTCPYATLDGVDLDEKLYNQAALDLFVKVFDALSGVYKVEIFIYPHNAPEDAAERTAPAYKYENTEKDNALERVLLANNDEIPFTIGQHNSPQTVKVVTYDAAGNISEMIHTSGQTVKGEILWDGVLVSTNVASQVFYNRPLFIGLIAVLLLLLLILFLIWRRRRNQENLAG